MVCEESKYLIPLPYLGEPTVSLFQISDCPSKKNDFIQRDLIDYRNLIEKLLIGVIWTYVHVQLGIICVAMGNGFNASRC